MDYKDRRNGGVQDAMTSKRSKTRPRKEPKETQVAEQAPQEGAEAVEGQEKPESAEQQTPSPDEQIRELEAQVAELKDRYLRALAELDNYRKRMQREMQAVRTRERIETVREFLTVFDHFEMAMAHAEESADLKTLKQGMEMILSEFRKAFENLGVERIDATGDEFSPELHEAVAQEPSEEVPAGRVVRQWKSGYRLGDQLLRPAAVVVSSGAVCEQKAEDEPC